jgi:hypothetical protein
MPPINPRTDTGKCSETFTMTGSAVSLLKTVGKMVDQAPRQVTFWTSDDYALVYTGAETDTVSVVAPYTLDIAPASCSATSGVKITCVY